MRYEDASHTGAFQGQGPVANDDTDQLAAGSKSSATGNLITGEGTQTGSAGADVATGGHITAIAGKGGEDSSFASGKLSVIGEYGKLSVDAEGNYVYQANKGVENVRDRFTYTLADNNGASDTASLIVEIGKTPFAIKANAQQIVVGPDGVVTLPAGVELSDVHVVGRNLVVDMPDGTQLIILDGAVFVPQLVLNGVEVPATNVAALLIGQEVQPAAGETPPSSGGNFAVPPPPLDPGVPLGDLIPPTEYVYKPPEPQEVEDIQDKKPEAGAASAQLDDDAQPNGNPLSNVGDDPGGGIATGNLPGSEGDGDLTWSLAAGGTLPAGYSIAAQPNGDLWVLEGAVHVLTIHVDPTNGNYTVTQLAALHHPAGGDENNLIFTVNYAVTDEDGDVANGTLTINVDDDTPTVNVQAGPDANVILTTDDAQTIGAASDSAVTTANFSGVFSGTSVVFGADGSGPGTNSTYVLAVTGQNSGLTSHGAVINLFVVGGVVVGTTAASAGAIDASNTIFTVSTTNTGIVTLTQFQQIDHAPENPSGAPFNDQIASMADGLVTLTRSETVVDGDGDQVTGSASVNIGANLHFTDDGPTIGLADRGEPTLNVDETDLSANDSASFAANFAASFGADGPAAGAGAITYALGVNAGATGLFDTATGAQVVLSVVNGQVIGTAGAGGPTVFVVSVDANGVVTLDQQRAVVHGTASDPDTSEAATTIPDNLITLTATAHDFDGDTASQSINIGANLSFHDDGPTATAGTSGQNVSVDETAGVQGDSNDTTNASVIALFAGVSNVGVDPDMAPQYGSNALAIVNSTGSAYGADGAGTTVFSLDVSAPGVDSGLDTTDGHDILLFKEGNLIVGRVDGGANDGEAAFAIAIDPATGVVSMVEYLSIDHPTNPNPDESLSIDNGAIQAVVTVTDKDGDFDTSSVNIGSHIQFQDDGPTAAVVTTGQAVSVDETPGVQGDSNDTTNAGVIALFAGVANKGVDPDMPAQYGANASAVVATTGSGYGADGAGTTVLSLDVSAAGVDSGLDTTDGQSIFLFKEGDLVVGRVGGAGGPAAFAIAIDQTGHISMVEYLSIKHGNTANPDDSTSITNGAVVAVVTVTDGDGDPATSSVGIGSQIQFQDDGPAANNDTDVTDSATDTAVGNVITGAGTTEGTANHDVPGADAFGSITNLVGFNGSTDGNPSGGFDVTGQFGTLHMDANGQYTYSRTGGSNGSTDTFTYTYVDGDGDPASATLTITILDGTPTAGTVNIALDDDVIPGKNGILDGPGDDDPDVVGQNVASGTLPGSGSDTPLTFGFGTNVAPSGFTYDTSVANTLVIKQGSVTVITITINPITGAYTVTQNNPIDHSAGDGENNQTFAIDYTVKDFDLDTAHGTININVDDDSPVAVASAAGFSISHDETVGVQGDANDVAGPLAQFAGVANVGDDPDVAGSSPLGFAVSTGAISSTGSGYGADGAGSTVFSLNISSAGVDSGLNTTSGQDIFLFKEGNLVVGRVGGAGGVAAFAIAIDSATGQVSLVQYLSIQQTNTGSNDESVSLTNTVIQATVTVTDHDNDVATNSVNIGSLISFQDDGPTAAIVTTGQSVSLDETLGNQGDSNDVTGPIAAFAGVANVGDDPDVAGTGPIQFATSAAALVASTGSSYGVDGAGTTVFSLNIPSAGVDSGLNTTSGQDIFLFKEGNLIVGRVGGAGGAAAFALSIDPSTGVVSMVEYLSIQHPNTGNPDDSVSITNTSVQATVTVTDGDGDTATNSVNIGSLISFQDDGPTAAIVTTGQSVSLDETAGNQGDSNDVTGPLAVFSGVANVGDDPDVAGTGPIQFATSAAALVASTGSAYGVDGAGTTVFSLNIPSSGVDSGLNTTSGQDIFLFKEGNLIVGRVGNGSGPAAFALSIDPSTGVVSMVEYLSIQHPNTGNPDDSVSITNGSVQATVTVTDGDGDTATNSVNIGSLISFQDDGPAAVIGTTGQTVSLDESAGNQVDSNDVTGPLAAFAGVANVGDDPDVAGTGPIQFAANANPIVNSTGTTFGADGGTAAFSLNVSSAGVDSGLNTTSGQDIFLFKEGNVIVGRVGGAGGAAAFAIAIDPSTGAVSMVEYLSIQHSDPTNPDDSATIANGALLATVTATDGDGDTNAQSVAIGGLISFQDSGPIMTSASNINIHNDATPTFTGAFAYNLGADGAPTNDDVIKNVVGTFTVNGDPVVNPTLTAGTENATSATYTFSFDYDTGTGGLVHETGTLTFNKAAGTYTVTLDNPIIGISTLETANGTAFQGYQPNSTTPDNTQPDVSVTTILAESAPGANDGFFVQFTGQKQASGATDFTTTDNNSTFTNGELFKSGASWVSTSGSANGVAGDTIQNDEILDFNLYKSNPFGNLGANNTAQVQTADNMFLRFDGIGSAEDLIVVLKLWNDADHDGVVDNGETTTKAILVSNSDIYKNGTTALDGTQYEALAHSLDNNDGLMIIESNDYNEAGQTYKIIGAQILDSAEGVSGTAINLNPAVGPTGDSDTDNNGSLDLTNVNLDADSNAPLKVSSIGFNTVTTTDQDAHLEFQVTIQDGDGDTVTQTIAVDVTAAADSSTPISLSASVTTVAPVVLDLDGDGVQFLASDAGVRYDYNGDGVKEATAWVGANDGILVRDANGNGTVDGASEFVFGHDGLTDLQALAAQYGSTLDANDADYAKFGVWQDANSNGAVDAGEFKSLLALGINSINLTSDGQAYSAAGGDVQVAGSSTYARADGSTGVIADASFYSGESADEQRTLNGSGSTIAIAAAVAAAGLAASQTAAANDHADHGQEVAATAANTGSQVASVAQSDAGDETRSALANEVKESSDDVAPLASTGHSDASADSSHSLDDSHSASPASLNGSAANDDQGPADASADASPAAQAVMMVSAEALQAAGLDGNVQHDGSVEKIIADALGHGNGNGAVDALLDAFHGGNSGGAAIANLASAGSDAVSAWDMASNAASTGANEMLMKVGAEMLHHDAVQPTHNG